MTMPTDSDHYRRLVIRQYLCESFLSLKYNKGNDAITHYQQNRHWKRLQECIQFERVNEWKAKKVFELISSKTRCVIEQLQPHSEYTVTLLSVRYFSYVYL